MPVVSITPESLTAPAAARETPASEDCEYWFTAPSCTKFDRGTLRPPGMPSCSAFNAVRSSELVSVSGVGEPALLVDDPPSATTSSSGTPPSSRLPLRNRELDADWSPGAAVAAIGTSAPARTTAAATAPASPAPAALRLRSPAPPNFAIRLSRDADVPRHKALPRCRHLPVRTMLVSDYANPPNGLSRGLGKIHGSGHTVSWERSHEIMGTVPQKRGSGHTN